MIDHFGINCADCAKVQKEKAPARWLGWADRSARWLVALAMLAAVELVELTAWG
jgi:hypothetical protein